MMTTTETINPHFLLLARGFFGRRGHDIQDTPTEIEVECEDCLVTAAPNPKDARSLMVSIAFTKADDRTALTSPDALALMHRLNANAVLASDWRYVIANDGQPLLVANAALDTLNVDAFETLLADAVSQAGTMIGIATADWSATKSDPPTLASQLTMIRG